MRLDELSLNVAKQTDQAKSKGISQLIP